MRILSILFSLTLSAGAGCGGDDTRPAGGADGGGTGGIDSGPPGTSDGGGGGTTDAGPGGGTTDAGGGGTTDAGPGGGTTDAGGATDSGTAGGDDREGVVECMEATCTLPDQVCCVGLSGSECTAADACGGGLSAPQHCDGPEDCGAGELCCASFPSGAACATSCDGQELCHDDGDCTGGDSCMSCSFPGSPPTDVCTTSC